MDVFIDWFNEIWKRDPNGITDEMEGDANPAAIAAMSKRMADHLDLFERMLEGRDYLMGNEVSAADFAAFPFLKYATIPMQPDDAEPFHKVLDDHLQPGDQHSRLKAWIERIDALPRA
jgi:glutathione S-transferase